MYKDMCHPFQLYRVRQNDIKLLVHVKDLSSTCLRAETDALVVSRMGNNAFVVIPLNTTWSHQQAGCSKSISL